VSGEVRAKNQKMVRGWVQEKQGLFFHPPRKNDVGRAKKTDEKLEKGGREGGATRTTMEQEN